VSVGYDSHGDGEHQDLVDGDGNEEIMLFVHPKVSSVACLLQNCNQLRRGYLIRIKIHLRLVRAT
jgi:hypothetical protein